jgi:hypothetical protein
MDAYYEIASYLDILMKKELSFIIRARRDRIWMRKIQSIETDGSRGEIDRNTGEIDGSKEGTGGSKREENILYEKARIEDFPE